MISLQTRLSSDFARCESIGRRKGTSEIIRVRNSLGRLDGLLASPKWRRIGVGQDFVLTLVAFRHIVWIDPLDLKVVAFYIVSDTECIHILAIKSNTNRPRPHAT